MVNMNENKLQLWSCEGGNNPEVPSVSEYFSLNFGEFDFSDLESQFPYSGSVSSAFIGKRRRKASESPRIAYWRPRYDRFMNDFTADILAAADLLGGVMNSTEYGSVPGGLGAEGGDIRLSLLDGGVDVSVSVIEHLTTNRLSGFQRTRIYGPSAFRAIFTFLGFDWPKRRFLGEGNPPTRQKICEFIDNKLVLSGCSDLVVANWNERKKLILI